MMKTAQLEEAASQSWVCQRHESLSVGVAQMSRKLSKFQLAVCLVESQVEMWRSPSFPLERKQ